MQSFWCWLLCEVGQMKLKGFIGMETTGIFSSFHGCKHSTVVRQNWVEILTILEKNSKHTCKTVLWYSNPH